MYAWLLLSFRKSLLTFSMLKQRRPNLLNLHGQRWIRTYFGLVAFVRRSCEWKQPPAGHQPNTRVSSRVGVCCCCCHEKMKLPDDLRLPGSHVINLKITTIDQRAAYVWFQIMLAASSSRGAQTKRKMNTSTAFVLMESRLARVESWERGERGRWLCGGWLRIFMECFSWLMTTKADARE